MMSKKMIVGIAITAVTITLLVATVAGAQDDPVLKSLYKEIFGLEEKVVERRVELGDLTPEEGDYKLEQMEKRFQEMTEEGFRPFNGMFGGGWGHHGHHGDRTGRHDHCDRY